MKIAAALNVTRNDAACYCMAVWEWADENTVDGHALSVTPACLSETLGTPGIAEAMVEAGWLLADGRGIIFPNWDRYNAASAKKRIQDRERQRRYRERQRESGNPL